MKTSEWLRFSWDLNNVPPEPPATPERYQLRFADRSEEDVVQKVAEGAFGLDSAWVHHLKILAPFLSSRVEEIFDAEEVDCVVLSHGQRIIGVSILDSGAEAQANLLTGPLVLAEYRSRGLGSLLLQESLRVLKAKGLGAASGITPRTGPAARFVYPKFGGVAEPCDFALPA